MNSAGNGVVSVAVRGGSLAVQIVTAATEPVLAIHGISSQRRLWNWLRAADPALSLIASDLLADGKVRLSGKALVADSASVFFGPSRWAAIGVPTRLLAAQWSRGPDTEPAYNDEALRSFRGGLSSLVEVRRLAGADHAASIMSAPGAAATAGLIAAALAMRSGNGGR